MSADLEPGGGFSMDLEGEGGFDLEDMLREPESGGGDDTDPVLIQKKANELLAKQLADQGRELSELKGRLATRPYDTTLEGERPTPPAPPPQPVVDVEKLKKELADQAVNDPGGFALRIYDASIKAAQQMIEQRTGPLANGNAMLDVQQYRSSRSNSDPDFKDYSEEFDKLVQQAAPGFANLTPAQRREQLDFLADTAYGRTQRTKSRAVKRDRTPPPYGGGEAFTSGTVEVATYKGKKLNNVQKEIMRMAHESGIKDPKRIKAMLDDAENE